VTTTHLRCQVLEVSHQDHWPGRRGAWPRDLLPWADPYIARLIRRLEERFHDEDSDPDLSDPFGADDEPWSLATADHAWEEDAFLPQPADVQRDRWHAPVYGGFPLLDDVSTSNDADPL
jgi:hypothetical protein